jgi:hypothetical protein
MENNKTKTTKFINNNYNNNLEKNLETNMETNIGE